jgi:Fic family protein
MTRKKGVANKPDVLAKFFIKHYNIATQKDLAKLETKLDRIENQLKIYTSGKSIQLKYKIPRDSTKITNGDIIYDVIKRHKNGLNFSEIQAKTGFGARKVRNQIYKLHKAGIIKRKSRGVYIAD